MAGAGAAVQGNRPSGSSTRTRPGHQAVKTVTKQQHTVCISISNGIVLHSWAQVTSRYYGVHQPRLVCGSDSRNMSGPAHVGCTALH